MAESLIAEIKKFRSMAAKLTAEIEKLKASKPTPEITERIKNNEQQLAALQASLAAKQKQFEADKAEWEGMKSEVDEAKDKMAKMTEWGGTVDVSHLKSDFSGADGYAAEENYREAINRIKGLKTGLEKPWKEYEAQKEAQGKYESEKQDIDIRIEAVKASAFQTDGVKKGVATLEGNLPQTVALADKKDFVKALPQLETAKGELGLVEKEVDKAAADDAAARKELEPVKVKAADAAKIEFEELKPRIDAATNAVGQAEALIDSHDYNGARAELGPLSTEFDAIKAEADKLEAAKKAEEEKKRKLKEEWERQAGRYEALKVKVADLEGWEAPEAGQLRQVINDIEGYVASEDYVAATDRLAQGEGEVAAPHAEFLKQQEAKKTYDAARPGLNDRAQTARSSQYCDDAVNTALGELDADFSWMDGQEKSRKYTEANTRIAGATQELDKIEQLLREAEIRAKLAEEMGGASSEEVEREVKKRLYEAEQPPAQQRVDAAQKADVLDRDSAAQLQQHADELAAAATAAQAQDFAKALESVRLVVGEMPLIEERVRKQTELKKLYEAARDKASERIKAFGDSAYKAIRDDAAKAQGDLDAAGGSAEAHDYAKAQKTVEALGGEIDRIAAAAADIEKAHAEADALLIEIQNRIDKALAEEGDDIRSAQAELKAKKDEVDGFYHDEDYKGAVTALTALKDLLVKLEEAINRATQKDLYTSAVDTLKLDEKLAAMRADAYPEAAAESGAAEMADSERLAAAKAEQWEDARRKAFGEDTVLGSYTAKKDAIELARDQVEHNAAERKDLVAKALAPADPTSDEFTKAQQELKDLVAKLDAALAAKRFIEAGQLADQVKVKGEEVEKLRFELGVIDEAETVEWIRGQVLAASRNFGGAASSAVLAFKFDLNTRINTDRGFQKDVKKMGYSFDVAAAIAGCIPGYGAAAAAVLTTMKTGMAMVSDHYDDEADNADQEAANEIIEALEKRAAEVEGCFNTNYGSKLKGSNRAKFDEIGRCLVQKPAKDYSRARSLLEAEGVPVSAGFSPAKAQFLGQLRAQMKEKRG